MRENPSHCISKSLHRQPLLTNSFLISGRIWANTWKPYTLLTYKMSDWVGHDAEESGRASSYEGRLSKSTTEDVDQSEISYFDCHHLKGVSRTSATSQIWMDFAGPGSSWFLMAVTQRSSASMGGYARHAFS